MPKINLLSLDKNDLQKNIKELQYNQIEDENLNLIKNHKIFKITANKQILIGTVQETKSKNVISCNGYYISLAAIEKIENYKFYIGEAKLTPVSNEYAVDCMKEIQNLLNEVNNMRNDFFDVYNDLSLPKFPLIYTAPKPYKELYFTYNSEYLENFYPNTPLSEIYEYANKRYEGEMKVYNNQYETNSKLLNKVLLSDRFVIHTTQLKEDNCDIIGDFFDIRKDYLRLYTDKTFGNIVATYKPIECSFDVYKRCSDLFIEVQKLYNKYK